MSIKKRLPRNQRSEYTVKTSYFNSKLLDAKITTMIFSECPKDFDKTTDVVGCYLQYNSRFVLLQRKPEKPNGNKWGLPAGKIDEGETKKQAVLREVYEETGVLITEPDLSYFSSVWVRDNDLDFEYHMFSVKFNEEPEIKINDREHQNYQWVTPQESLQVDLIPDQENCTRLFYCL